MDEELQIEDQVQNGGSQEGQSENQSEGEANETSKVKIGDVEYTPEQLAEIVKKGSQYDELLPDYTRKSQKLSEYENNIKNKENKEEDNTPPFLREGWEPKTYKELQEAIRWAKDAGKEEALKTLQQKESEAQQVKQEVDKFVSDIKLSDKNFNEQDFFNYVLRHNFPAESIDNLKAAYSTYKELNTISKTSNKNEADAIVNKGSEGGNGKDFSDLRINGGDMVSTALEALKRIK